MKTIFFSVLFVSILSACSNNISVMNEKGGEIKILRDEYGTPHIYADNTYDLFYGYGYSVAQDRLFQMEMAKRSTQGSVAQVLGAEYLEFDINARKLYSPASIKSQLAALSAKDKDIFEGYAAGMNAWIAQINQQADTLMPKQFNDFEFTPSQWSSFDVVMIFVGTMANRFGDFNSELDNLKISNDLIARFGVEKGQAIFDVLNPRFTSGTATTISENDWVAPASTLNKYEQFASQLPDFILDQDLSSKPISGFSNIYLIGKEKTKDANAVLVNGPQFGWFDPAYTYSVGLHGAGFDVVGNTPFAYPTILFGHNADIGWGSTWGAGDIVDMYTLELDPNDPLAYRYKGEFRKLESRKESIYVKNGNTHEYEIFRSVHGQVVAYDKDNLVAISKKRTWDGKELESLLTWVYQATASNYDEWLGYADDYSLNVNWYYADRSGNIGYAFTGHYPIRQASHDNRLPVNGDGSMDWLGTQDFSHNPSALNPEANFIANWNNKPAHGVLNPDMHWYSWSSADRVDFLHDALSAQEHFTPQQAWDLIETSSYGDLVAKFLLPLIDEATTAKQSDVLKALNPWLQEWDRQANDKNGDGYYDQSQYLFIQTFAQNLIAAVLKDDLKDSFVYFQGTGYPTKAKPTSGGMNLSSGLKATYEALIGKTKVDLLNGKSANAIVAKVAEQTYSQLSQEYGNDVKQWQLALYPRAFRSKNFMGIPQNNESGTPSTPLEQNRGTENNMSVFYTDSIEGFEVAPPGQSGFIAPDGTPSPHMYDQMDLYENFGKKRMWFYKEDVIRQAKTEIILNVVR